MTETRRTLLFRVRDRADQEAWAEFFALYAPLLEGYARAHGLSAGDAEEVRDQCLALVVGKMPDFEYSPARGGFKAWLHKLAAGRVVDLLRRPHPRHAETVELGALADRGPTPDEAWEEGWRAQHLAYCLERVRARETPAVFTAFELLCFEGKSVAEVCAQMGWNANQVYKAKSRVLRRVRETFEALGTGEGPLVA